MKKLSIFHKLSLTNWILLALGVGTLLGLIIHSALPAEFRIQALDALRNAVKAGTADAALLAQREAAAAAHWLNNWLVDGVFKIGADIFLRTLKMLVVPLVFVSLVSGVTSLGDPRMLGRIGSKTILFYIVTTALAITTSLTLGNLLGVGTGFSIQQNANFSISSTPPLSQVIVDIFPSNPFQAMASGMMLQVIFFSILFGLGITLIGERGKKITDIFASLNEVMMKMVMILMAFAPIGVFCVVTAVFARQGVDPILGLLKYFVVMIIALLLHAFGVYGLLLKLLAGLSPMRFFANMRPAAYMAFSTASSNATIPVSLETAEKHQGVDNTVASFTIPLGATVNMDGTSIMQGLATIFIANAAGVDLTLTQLMTVILMATLSSIGTAGVPGAGMITLAMVLKQVGLPEEGILLLLPVDRILDMCRTAVNITGDLAATCIVAKHEGRLDEKCFNQPLGLEYGDVNFKET